MAERDSLLNRIKMYDFILLEMHLFLNTHPDCQSGLDYFKKYQELRRAANEEYKQKFGALTAGETEPGNHWTWIDNPWPWEREANL